jgi:hypothetical protein
LRFAILDCAHVKSALPFHIRENLTGQGFGKSERQKGFGIEALRDWELVKAKSLAPQ